MNLDKLSQGEREELDMLLRQQVWEPLPGPQTLAYESEADVIGYGGAAGGGKTDLAVGLAVTQHRVVQIFRREGTELRAIVDRMVEILGHDRGLGGKPPIWKDPTALCKVVEFCSVPNPGDERKYQGRPKDLLVFDEATNFLESQVRFVSGWLRSTVPGQRKRMLLTFNPPTSASGQWVIDYFGPWLDDRHPNPAEPGELRWFATVAGADLEVDGPEPFVLDEDKKPQYDFEPVLYEAVDIIKPMSRTFIPSRVTDNPFLIGTDYMAQLQALPEPLRSQMLSGDFKAGMEDDPFQLIPTAWVDAAMNRWTDQNPKPEMDSLGVDVAMGGKDDTVVLPRHGWWFDHPKVYPGNECVDGETIAGFIIAAKRDHAVIHLDLFGVGAQPYGHLMSVGQQTVGVNFGDPSGGVTAKGSLPFFNRRSEMWWRMREALDPRARTQIALPPNKRLRADLLAPKFELSGQRVKVEGRKELMKRLGRSLDYGAACILALLDTPKRRNARKLLRQVARPELDGRDPYADL